MRNRASPCSKKADVSFRATLGKNFNIMISSVMTRIALLGCAALLCEAGTPVREICDGEMFRGQCETDEVIMMTYAKYGRMQLGRCLSRDYGFIGCYTDVLRHMDARCSGRRSCTVEVKISNFPGVRKCSRDLTSYLKATFKCVKVVRPHSCKYAPPPVLTASSGTLANAVTLDTECGSVDRPWMIQLAPGQRVNFTLFDFSSPPLLGGNGSGDTAVQKASKCRVYATVRDGGATKGGTICGGRGGNRIRVAHESRGHQVQVRLMPSAGKETRFLLRYSAIGCGHPPKPVGGWLKRDGKAATVGCGQTKSWSLKCVNYNWVGEYRNCTESDEGAVFSSAAPGTMANLLTSVIPLPYGMAVLIVVSLAVIIGLVILMVGLMCLKTRLSQQPTEPVPPVYGPTGTSGRAKPPGNGWNAQKENEYASMRLLPPLPYDGRVLYPQIYDTKGRIGSRRNSRDLLRSDSASEHLYESPDLLNLESIHHSNRSAIPHYFDLDPDAVERLLAQHHHQLPPQNYPAQLELEGIMTSPHLQRQTRSDSVPPSATVEVNHSENVSC